ncbi:MAG: hypothetical protein HY532_03155 [Chloroflexi bacterium]|nr:hypothetical protein [Chloroflexota bacterium]
MPLSLALVACTSAQGVAEPPETAAPREWPTVEVQDHVHHTGTSDEDAGIYFTINVDITDAGIQPSTVFVPAGQRVKLVLRNRATAEHHYRVLGLEAADLLWLAEPEGEQEQGVTDEDHEMHHSGEFVPWRATSPAGVKPTGNEVHAYAPGSAGGMDVVLFTAHTTGTFLVQCPLHPEMTAKLIIF